MGIKRIKISNFKSFRDLDLELGNFNVVIGANASGKSNFTQIFKFIRDISSLGLDNAISLQGSEYLTNVGGPLPKILTLFVTYKPEFGLRLNKSVLAKINEATYEFTISFKNGGVVEDIIKDRLRLKVDYINQEKESNIPGESPFLGSGEINLSNEGGNLISNLKKPEELDIEIKEILPPFFPIKIPVKTLLLQGPFFKFPPFSKTLDSVSIYDFDPKLSKKAVPIVGKSELEEDGSNLSLVLKNIIEDSEKKRKFSNILKDILPFVEDMKTDKYADKFLQLKLRESYSQENYFPVSAISDGTVNIAALITALYFERKEVMIIEEPERNIHPYLISKVVDMMKDAARKKQIIATTHSPEVVKHAGLENLLLVYRDKAGLSQITRPKDKEEVKVFLENELGLDDLFVQNLLTD